MRGREEEKNWLYNLFGQEGRGEKQQADTPPHTERRKEKGKRFSSGLGGYVAWLRRSLFYLFISSSTLPSRLHFLPLPLIMKSRHASFVSRSSLLLLPFYGDTWILPVGERKNEKKESVRDEGEREFKKWRIGMSEERETQHHQPIKRKKKKLRIPFLPLSHLSARRLHNSLTYRWTTISLPFPFTYMEKGKRERLCEWRKWE